MGVSVTPNEFCPFKNLPLDLKHLQGKKVRKTFPHTKPIFVSQSLMILLDQVHREKQYKHVLTASVSASIKIFILNNKARKQHRYVKDCQEDTSGTRGP